MGAIALQTRREIFILCVGVLMGGLGSTAGYLYTAGVRLTAIETRLNAIETPPSWFKERVDNHIADDKAHVR
tara:strand:- start:289 stop:504 length:216 start_codon:yes stop_codon:yes gene_type:complete